MKKVYDKCCGIDVHKKIMVACFIHGKEQEIREFGATTRELLALADWLEQGGCEMVAMESTASYWKPLYNILETSNLPAMVVNARHMKAVPGRKTDVKDAEWIADLLQHGLLQASYIPDKAQRELRELVGYRKSLVADRTRELNRLQKMLEGANIKLSGTVAEINGMSARIILNELLDGKTIDKTRLEEMKKQKIIAHNLRASFDQIADDLNGVMSPLQNKMMRELLKHIDELKVHLKNLAEDIDNHMNDEEKKATSAITEIGGIAGASAKAIISVIGTDMSRFPTDAHISSWAGLCPGNNESAGKKRSTKIRHGNSYLKRCLCQTVFAAKKQKGSPLAERYYQIQSRRGPQKATIALAHQLLKIAYILLKENLTYQEFVLQKKATRDEPVA